MYQDWLSSIPAWLADSPEWVKSFVYELYKNFVYDDRWKLIVDGLKITFIVTIGALILGIIIGIIIGLIRTTHDTLAVNKKPSLVLRIFNKISVVYLAVIRGTPMMVQLLIMCFVVMQPSNDSGRIVCGIVTLGINSGAYVAEIARSGIMSIDKGQTEAGRSLGFSYAQTMIHFIIPQAVKNILPALGNEMITLLKDTSLVSTIALSDVTKATQKIISVTYKPIIPYISLAIIYLIIVLVLTKLLNIFERRLRQSDR